MLKSVFGGISAGILIAIGGTVFLSSIETNKYIGAILFSVALLCICMKGYALFTGKVGFILENHTRSAISEVLLCLLGNTAACTVSGYAIAFALPELKGVALGICEAKLAQSIPSAIIRAVFCGMLMYLAVSIYRENKSISGIFFCVPVFIISGFEHSIADIFYFATSGIVSLEAFVYIIIIILGNALGGMLLPIIKKIEKRVSNE